MIRTDLEFLLIFQLNCDGHINANCALNIITHEVRESQYANEWRKEGSKERKKKLNEERKNKKAN